MTTTEPTARAALSTPRAPGAIAVIHLAGDIDAVLSELGAARVEPGALALRDLAGIDTAVVARLDDHRAILTPHGGPAITDALLRALERAGAPADHDDPALLYPEAEDETQALALHTLARAASPRATALLLDQPRRWRASQDADPIISAQLNRLVTAPVVACAGAPNIGKSTLLNALAGRTVSVVADEPGVTRDHVGALLELDGLTVRWLDAPGLRAATSDAEARAIKLARDAIAHADLVLLCADAAAAAPSPEELGVDPASTLILGLRSDLGPARGADLCVSAARSEGLADLVLAVRRRLVPDAALASPAPWRFDARLPPVAR